MHGERIRFAWWYLDIPVESGVHNSSRTPSVNSPTGIGSGGHFPGAGARRYGVQEHAEAIGIPIDDERVVQQNRGLIDVP